MSHASLDMPQTRVVARFLQFLLIAVIAFLTRVDLFATQVILPALTVRYRVSPAAMGAAVGACAFGMAVWSLQVALFADQIDGRPLAGRFGPRRATCGGLPLATGFVARTAKGDGAAARGLYLACCFSGGLAGAIALGQVCTVYGWHAMSARVAGVPMFSALLARDFDVPKG